MNQDKLDIFGKRVKEPLTLGKLKEAVRMLRAQEPEHFLLIQELMTRGTMPEIPLTTKTGEEIPLEAIQERNRIQREMNVREFLMGNPVVIMTGPMWNMTPPKFNPRTHEPEAQLPEVMVYVLDKEG